MELRQLKAFVTVARTGSFTRAARLLDYAQSSITAQVSSLEDELNTKLFERLGRKITLTRDGEQLLAYAEKILRLSSDAKELISGSVTPRGTLSVGATETLSIYRLPLLLQEYRKRYPNVKFIVVTGKPTDLIHWLKTNEIDVAFFFARGTTDSDLVSETLLHEPMVMFSGVGHPLIEKAPITPTHIPGETLILCARGCCYREALEDMLDRKGLQAGSVIEIDNIEAVKKCVISGLGISLLPRVTVEAELAQGKFVDLRWSGPDFKIVTLVAYHKNKWISPALDALLKLAREIV
ncbi:LysR family transcriptional regulator [Desulforudis sp. 1088]|uniref:LysR family transcriptional regulator n=1 Tax=unclassified Candidatus Desulforudis TaxID=2635950 RepID=UPI003CE45479